MEMKSENRGCLAVAPTHLHDENSRANLDRLITMLTETLESPFLAVRMSVRDEVVAYVFHQETMGHYTLVYQHYSPRRGETVWKSVTDHPLGWLLEELVEVTRDYVVDDVELVDVAVARHHLADETFRRERPEVLEASEMVNHVRLLQMGKRHSTPPVLSRYEIVTEPVYSLEEVRTDGAGRLRRLG